MSVWMDVKHFSADAIRSIISMDPTIVSWHLLSEAFCSPEAPAQTKHQASLRYYPTSNVARDFFLPFTRCSNAKTQKHSQNFPSQTRD